MVSIIVSHPAFKHVSPALAISLQLIAHSQ